MRVCAANMDKDVYVCHLMAPKTKRPPPVSVLKFFFNIASLFVWTIRPKTVNNADRLPCSFHVSFTCEFHITNQPEETTLVSSAQPTNQPTGFQPLVPDVIYSQFPTSYMSVRITLSHSLWDSLFDSCFSDVDWYISFPHMGKNGNNPHFHVLLPADGPKDLERIRKRIKTAGYTGNKQFSIKYM